MNWRINLGVLFVSLFSLSFLFGDDPLKKVLDQLEKYRSQYPQEKIHLHFDKPYYAIGDTIWFKAYLVNSEKNQLTEFSKIIYVDLINDKDSTEKTLLLPVQTGLASGDFTLSDNLPDGYYRIRAYTNWMRNFGEEYFFDKIIYVGNPAFNEITTQVNYTYSTKNNLQKVVAHINYSDRYPLSTREVQYMVQFGKQIFKKGKGFTDEKGNIQISFINKQPSILKYGSIQTKIKLNAKQTIVKNFFVKSTSNKVDFQFFPEGGNLLTGINSKVAFKALGADGLGIDAVGFITDQNKKKVAEFKTAHLGMGYFSLQPQKNFVYQATVQFSDGSERSFPLPEVRSEGYSLSCSDSDTNLKVVISSASNTPDEEEVTLVAQSNGIVHYAAKNKMTNRVIDGSIPKKRFPTGILQLTLFSSLNEPLAERLVFINHTDFLHIDIIKDDIAYSKRQKVNMSLNVKDTKGKPAVGSFSVAVIDETKVPFNDDLEITILSNLLLTSELKGYIERPNYYFSNTDDHKRKNIDLLMLTQGYRRFTWKNILTNSFPALKFHPEESLEVKGTVTQLNGKKLMNTGVSLISIKGDALVLNTRTNIEGRFTFQNLFFNDSTTLLLKSLNQKNKNNVKIQPDKPSEQVVSLNKNYPRAGYYDNAFMVKYLENNKGKLDVLKRYQHGTNLLNEVVIIAREDKIKNSTNLNGSGNADAVIPGEKLQKYISLFDGIEFNMPAGIGVKNGVFYSKRGGGVQVILDGVYIDQSDLSTINPVYVEAIEILYEGAKTAIYGKRAYGMSIMLITSISGTVRNITPQIETPGLLKYSPKGFYKVREFYSPKYSIQNTTKRMSDLRSTIYWNPLLLTDTTGTTSFDFFTSDNTGDYKVIIEGINTAGKIGRQILRFKVK